MVAIADLLEEVKTETSKWMKTKGPQFKNFHWQRGYGAFSIGQSQVEDVKRYIGGQKEHHRRVTFQEEYRRFLKAYGIEYDERYVWGLKARTKIVLAFHISRLQRFEDIVEALSWGVAPGYCISRRGRCGVQVSGPWICLEIDSESSSS